MSNLTTPFLDEDKRDSANILPAVQKLLQLAYSEDPDKQLEVRNDTILVTTKKRSSHMHLYSGTHLNFHLFSPPLSR